MPIEVLAPQVAPATPLPSAGADVRLRAVRHTLLVGATAGAGVLLLLVHDPHALGSYGFCPLRLLTGFACPACGALRATNELVHLDLAAAWSSNALWVTLVPMILIAWVVVLVRRWRGHVTSMPPALWSWIGLAVIVAFGVLRNLPVPALAWMAP